MKIAIVTSTFPPYRGGMGNVAYFHAKELSARGNEVMVFCPKGPKGKFENEGFKVEYIGPILRYGNAAWVPQLYWRLKGFDIVHFHYPFFGGAEAVWLARKKRNKEIKKLVMTYHMDTVGKGWLGVIFKVYKKLFLSKIIDAADKVLISTQDYARNGDLADYIEQDPEKFIVSNLGVDIERFSPGLKPDELFHQYHLAPDDFVLLFVGGLDKAHYFKGLDYLLKAAAMIGTPNIKLIVVGEGELRKGYEETAKRLGIEKRVHFVGPVSNEDLPDYYRLCDVFVFPSIDKSEAYGLVALEAGACAKPTIASNLPGVRFVVKDNETGILVEPKNTDELAEKIKYLLNNQERAKELGENARKRIEAEFVWRVIVEKLENIYKAL